MKNNENRQHQELLNFFSQLIESNKVSILSNTPEQNSFLFRSQFFISILKLYNRNIEILSIHVNNVF